LHTPILVTKAKIIQLLRPPIFHPKRLLQIPVALVFITAFGLKTTFSVQKVVFL